MAAQDVQMDAVVEQPVQAGGEDYKKALQSMLETIVELYVEFHVEMPNCIFIFKAI